MKAYDPDLDITFFARIATAVRNTIIYVSLERVTYEESGDVCNSAYCTACCDMRMIT